MLTEICAYLRNYFDTEQPKFFGDFTISDGVITSESAGDMGLQEGQYYRVMGSVFNDGVWKHGDTEQGLQDESFSGAVWLMAVPPALILLLEEIKAWQDKYGGVDSENMSPFSSESFSGYSYTKAQGFAATGGGMLNSWQAVYGQRLARWKKL